MLVLPFTIGCGSGDGELRSTLAEPTVDLTVPGPEPGIVWSDLATLFPEDGPALPAPIASLVPGTVGEEATTVLDAARAPGVTMERQEVAGHVIVRSVLRDWTDVTVSLVLDAAGETLEQVNLSLPADAALAALGDQWGAPVVEVGREGRPVYRWRKDGAAWRAELDVPRGDRAVLSYERP